MTVESEVANLTTAVDGLTSAVNVKKATLDASVANAQAASGTAVTASGTALGYSNSAAASAASAASTATALTGFDLAAIAASKAITAVAGCIYDTSKDSDGGAWRKRTQHTGWYNEPLNTATRGSRREFPAVAVIIAEANKVTIFDGDDPALPMWMVFNANTGSYSLYGDVANPITAVQAINGEVVVSAAGTFGALSRINFPLDASSFVVNSTTKYVKQNLTLRNSTLEMQSIAGAANPIVNRTVNDVAMTVLPNAPIDPATGLQVPTIAVATAGGVSVIKDDGTVVDITTGVCQKVAIADDGLWVRNGDYIYRGGYPATDSTIGSWRDWYAYKTDAGSLTLPNGVVTDLKDGSVGTTDGLAILAENQATPASGMVAHVTSSWNSGYQNGDIKGAFLSDTSATALVGSGELVTNGTFDTDVTGWTDSSVGTGSVDASTSAAVLTTVNASNRAILDSSFPTVVGRTYFVTFARSSASEATSGFHIGTSSGGTQIVRYDSLGNGTQLGTFTATTTTTYIRIYGTYNAGSITYDNISIKLADADRSVNNKGLIVNGTITRTPVATGANLVAYSGFSAANYLQQPYNSALDFGTGDFCVMGWVKWIGSVSSVIFDRSNGTDSANRINIYIQSSGIPHLIVNGTDVANVGSVPVGVWAHTVFMRKGGALFVYVNGVLQRTVSSTSSVTGSFASRFGLNVAGSTSFNGSLALWRISATAPTAEQIAKIYNDEKFLFQDGAQATLYGTSDAVTALAYDDDTNLLSVGTSAGRSDFQGLRRVANTTTAVSTFISAGNAGMILEQ